MDDQTARRILLPALVVIIGTLVAAIRNWWKRQKYAAKLREKYPVLARLQEPTLGFKQHWKASLTRALISLVIALLAILLGMTPFLFQANPNDIGDLGMLSLMLVLFGAIVMLPVFVFYSLRTIFDLVMQH